MMDELDNILTNMNLEQDWYCAECEHGPMMDDDPNCTRCGAKHSYYLDQNAKLLNIVYEAGTFGNFLRYFLERFSNKTPYIPRLPFMDTGTNHTLKNKDFSRLIQRYHPSFINDNEGNINLPVCLIVPSRPKHFLYLKQAQLFRAANGKASPDDLWKKTIVEISTFLADYVKEIKKLYDIKDTSHFTCIPKFIVRDWYKLEFLQDVEETYNYQLFEQLKEHPFWEAQKVFWMDLETFFDWDDFVENITELNEVFGLALDFNRQAEMKEIFDRGLSLDPIRQECNLAEAVLENRSDARLDNLDVATEGYIYAQIEKANPDIQMPVINRFFRDMDEIRQFLAHFPNWYRRPNPNLG